MNRREALAAGAVGLTAVAVAQPKDAPLNPKNALKITKLETFLVQPRWLFLKVHTDAGIVGLGEPIVEGRAETVATAVKEIEPYLVGKDPRQVTHHWQAIYRHAFYRGGPVLTSALSGIDMALWDIKGKALGVPVYELLGGPTRSKIRVYAHARTPAAIKQGVANGFTAFKTGPQFRRRYPRYIETPSQVNYAVEQFAALRKAGGDDVDIGIDFHGKVSPALAKVLIKGLEPYQPMFVEEPVNCQNHDLMAEIARGTHLPIATGERVFTKWGFREVLEKKAATVLQPDLCHAGGITECRLIAGMAEAYYAAIAPHNPLGPISLAAGIQLAASIPNFLCQEQVSLGEGYLKTPFVVKNGFVDLPTGPGLGIELDEAAVAKKIGHQWKNTESFDEDDGSVVDW
ncbi:MAG: galactonate dehydratase [Planctomycetia bacterium]|nr:galactonate dehydratase [Planctomycetia bacterium]